jgi:hypothetical protein
MVTNCHIFTSVISSSLVTPPDFIHALRFFHVFWTSRLTLFPILAVFGQMIGQFDPADLASGPCVVPRRRRVWHIKAARRDVDFVQEVFVLKGQLRAALRTETARAFRRRPKAGGLTGGEPELRPRHTEPCDERSASRSTTDRAMAVCFMKGRTRCLITDSPAKASALQHCISLLEQVRLSLVKLVLNYRANVVSS